MKLDHTLRWAVIVATFTAAPAVSGNDDIGTATPVQGELKDSNGQPLDGSADFKLEVCDQFGQPTGQTVTFLDVVLSNGKFTIVPDFGPGVFTGEPRGVKVSVRYPHDPTDTLQYELLTPPIDVKPAPEAINSQQAQKVQLPLIQAGDSTQSLINIENTSTDPNSVAVEGRSTYGMAAKFFSTNGAAVEARSVDGNGLRATTVGIGNALFANALGDEGAAGFFVVGDLGGPPSTNTFPAINALNEGTGDGGRFLQTNEDSPATASAVRGINRGFGSAGVFAIEFAPNFNTSPALRATTDGDGVAGHFEVDNADNPTEALFATSNAVTGGLARFETATGTTSTVDAVTIDAQSTRHALLVKQHGDFEAAHFENDSPTNFAPVIYAQQLAGGGPVVDFRNLSAASSDVFLAFNQNGRVGYFGGMPAGGLPMFWIQNVTGAPGTTLLVQGEALLSKTTVSGEFSAGNTTINGNLCANTVCAQVKNFHIDHPLDPENKYLLHASVESNELKTIYDGTAELNARGEATIELPAWFEALNGDFRYQLTAIGAPAPELHVSQPVARNRFSIAGGDPGLTVSWQVTGVRHDAFALARPLTVEVDKPADERGRYLDPSVFGKPREMSVHHAAAQNAAAEIAAAEADLKTRLGRRCRESATNPVMRHRAE